MSTAKPMGVDRRLAAYLGSAWRLMREWDLTPAQHRRGWHKAHRSGERGGPGKGEELLGRKGRPTPRQRKRVTA